MLTKARIRNNVKLAEAPSFGRTIFEHAPDSNGARDYEAFAEEFLAMIGMASPVRDTGIGSPAAATPEPEPPSVSPPEPTEPPEPPAATTMDASA
jgi:chromosome partitioning protein